MMTDAEKADLAIHLVFKAYNYLKNRVDSAYFDEPILDELRDFIDLFEEIK